MTGSEPDETEEPRIGPSPAPGSGRPAADMKLGRFGLIVIIVVGVLYLVGMVAWSVFGPDVEVEVRHHRNDHHHREAPPGPGRLTVAPPPTAPGEPS